MLRSAVNTGLVDLQLPAEEMPVRLQQYFNDLHEVIRDGNQGEPGPEQLRRICTRVKTVTGHDFTEYKERTLIRRV